MTLHRKLNEALHGIEEKAEEISNTLDGKLDAEAKDIQAVMKLADEIIALGKRYLELDRS